MLFRRLCKRLPVLVLCITLSVGVSQHFVRTEAAAVLVDRRGHAFGLAKFATDEHSRDWRVEVVATLLHLRHPCLPR